MTHDNSRRGRGRGRGRAGVESSRLKIRQSYF